MGIDPFLEPISSTLNVYGVSQNKKVVMEPLVYLLYLLKLELEFFLFFFMKNDFST